MRKFHLPSIFIFLINLNLNIFLIDCFPCPGYCLCKPTDLIDEGFKRMSYLIDCRNIPLNDNKLIYQAQSWSILRDILNDDIDDSTNNDYIISIDLSNSSSLKEFHSQSIQLSNYSYTISSLSLTSQASDFILHSNAFNSSFYQHLKRLNLSSCCQQIPSQCPQLFQPLNQLELLDLSQSDMYKTCLNTQDTISLNLRDLILRNNNYSSSTFSHSSELFNGVRHITGKLDLQNSRFHMGTRLEGNCLFDLFTHITILDLSSIEFQSSSNDIDRHLAHLIRCRTPFDRSRNGEQLIELYLRKLNLQHLPDWFTNDRFPLLTHLDLSENQIHAIDLRGLFNLTIISLAFNPLGLDQIQWSQDHIYQSINLRGTIVNETLNLTTIIQDLFQFTTSLDYSENSNLISSDLKKFPIQIDFSDEMSLNLSQTNLQSFQIDDISEFERLTHLDLSRNSLHELNLIKQIELIYLDCSHQNLNKLIFNELASKFRQIKCSNNSLRSLENLRLFKHPELQSIDFSSNLLESIDELFIQSNNRRLQRIDFQSNIIRQISSNVFHEKLLSLYSINLSWNQINRIDPYAFQLPNLQILDLTGNPLKFIEPNFLFTSSLRLFYIINDTQQLISRCAQSKSDDNLLLTYINWFEQNSTYMKTIDKEKSELIQMDKCLRQYSSRSKIKWMKFNEKHPIKHLSLYIMLIVMSIGIVLSGIYWYKKKKRTFFGSIQHYRPLDRNHLIEQREDDEIVMNLEEPPFNTVHRTDC